MLDALVFLPGRGFMPAHALGTAANAVIRHNGHTFTGAVTPERDGIRVSFTVTGVSAEVPIDPFIKQHLGDVRLFHGLPEANARVVDDRGREVVPRPRWSAGLSLRADDDGRATLHGALILEHPAVDARSLTLTFDGPAGDWEVEFPLERIEHHGTLASRVDLATTVRGITVAVLAVARTVKETILEIEAYVDPIPDTGPGYRRVVGIGGGMRGSRLSGDPLILRDELRGMHLEHGRPIPEQTGGTEREAVAFEPVHADARTGTLTVDVVWVQEPNGEFTSLSIPGEADVTIAGCTGHVVVTREAGVYAEGRVKVVVSSDPESDRRLMFFQGVDAAGGSRLGMQVEHAIGRQPIVSVPEPTGTATVATLRAPVVQYRGPWRVEFDLPPVSAAALG
jgi:hypothetical protein